MADTTGAYEKGKLYQLELAYLDADPNQLRKFMDPQALEDLTESVRQHGVLMPILFRVGIGDSITAHPEPLEPAHPEPVEGRGIVSPIPWESSTSSLVRSLRGGP